jgi:hypothetical protein
MGSAAESFTVLDHLYLSFLEKTDIIQHWLSIKIQWPYVVNVPLPQST